MKNIILILLSIILLNSCELDYQNTRSGYIVPNLSKTNQIAISDGKDIFLITPDSIINDSLKLKIIFATKSTLNQDLDKNYHHNLFTVYKSGEVSNGRGYRGYYYYVSDGRNSIELEFNSIGHTKLKDGEKIIVIYRGDVTTPTYKVI